MQFNDFEKMVIPFKDKLYRFSLRIVGNAFDAEDVIQEVMVKLWKKREVLETVENKEAWCMTITRNMSIDWLRGKKKPSLDIADRQDIKDTSIDAQSQMELNDLQKMVRNCIAELPEKQKEVIHLRDIEGYSYKEIAEITHTSVDQVKVLIYRGRQRLKDIITKRKLWTSKQ